MKYLKVILYALLGIMSIYLVSNFFFSEKFKVSTSIEIDSSPFIVYDQINNFENWENWDPWLDTDTTIRMTLSDTPYGIDASRTWQSENSGSGKMEIIDLDFIKQIDFKITIDGNSPFLASFYLESVNNKVKVSWENSGELPFLARIFGPVISKMMKGDHVKGLDMLKRYCESIPSQSGEVSIQEWESQKIISKTDTCSSSNISQSLANIYSDVFKYVYENTLISTQSPFAQYLSFPQKPGDNDYVILKAGALVDNFNDTLNSNLKFEQTATFLSAQAIHKGDYRTLFDTHKKIQSYCHNNNYTVIGKPYEIYISDPETIVNPADWETLIIYEIE